MTPDPKELRGEARYYADLTQQWGHVIRDRSKPRPVIGARGDKPRSADTIVAAHIRGPEVMRVMLAALNAEQPKQGEGS